MKKILVTMILSLITTVSFADGHTSGKFNASGMGAWEVNAMNAGKGDMAITYDGIAGLTDEAPDSIFHKSTMHCIGGLTLQAGKFTDETGMCRFDLIDGESVYMKYQGEGTGGKGGTGTFIIMKGVGQVAVSRTGSGPGKPLADLIYNLAVLPVIIDIKECMDQRGWVFPVLPQVHAFPRFFHFLCHSFVYHHSAEGTGQFEPFLTVWSPW